MTNSVNFGSEPFTGAIGYFRKKLNIPTKKWDDLQNEAHDLGFMVAGAMQADLLDDLREAVDQAIADGVSIGAFRKNFDKIVAERGWTGWTGQGTKKGEAWRTFVIFDTNVRQAYNAGRERQIADPELRKRRPYGLYKHGDSIIPRKSHEAWDGKVIPLDDPWWNTHTPMNGFGCSCKKFTLSKRDVEKRGLKVEAGKDMPFQTEGVDKGFQYRPGGNEVRRMNEHLRDKAKKYQKGLRGFFMKFLDGILGK